MSIVLLWSTIYITVFKIKTKAAIRKEVATAAIYLYAPRTCR